MVLDKVFETIKEFDRTITKKRFCTEYLGKNENYLYVIKHENREPSSDALLKCYFGLKTTAEQLEENGFTSHNYHSNKKLADMVLEVIENKVVEQL